MEFIAIGLVCFIVLAWTIISAIRIEIVYKHLDKRIDEVYSSPNWHKYDVDVHAAYRDAMWDYRKWTYKDFFPEDVK